MPRTTDDDLYLNAGDDFQAGIYYPSEDEEAKKEEAEQKAVQASSYPIMDDVADWFREQIEECDHLENISIDSMTINGVNYSRKISVEAQLLAFQLLKTGFTDKLTEFQEFGKNRDEA